MQVKHTAFLLLLSVAQLNSAIIYQAFSLNTFQKRFPLSQISNLANNMKHSNLIKLQNSLKDILKKYKFPGLHFNCLGLLSACNILMIGQKSCDLQCVANLIVNIIQKLNYYSVGGQDIKNNNLILFSILNYLSNTLNLFIKILFEKDSFLKILGMVHSVLKFSLNNNINLLGQILLIIKIVQYLQNQNRKQFILFILSLTKNKDKQQLFNLLFIQYQNISNISINKLAILRINQQSLDKYALKIVNINNTVKIDKQIIYYKGKTFPVWVETAYKISPKFLPIDLNQLKKFQDVYDMFLLLQVFGNSPCVQDLGKYFEQQFLGIFIKYLTGEKIANYEYQFKKQKWKKILRELQKKLRDCISKQMKQNLKQDINTILN